jgi:hypothetical protein
MTNERSAELLGQAIWRAKMSVLAKDTTATWCDKEHAEKIKGESREETKRRHLSVAIQSLGLRLYDGEFEELLLASD